MTSQEEIFLLQEEKKRRKRNESPGCGFEEEKKRGLEREWERGCNWKHQ